MKLPTYPTPTVADLETDVLIVGGGIAGLTAARVLQTAGRQVVLLEANRLGGGETGHTTSHLTELLDHRYQELESKFGYDGARIAAESSRAAIDRIEAWAAEAEGRCHFRRVPAYLYAETDAQRSELEKELEALRRVGADAAWADVLPISISTRGVVRVEGQAQVHPLEYLRVLADRVVADGGRIFESTRMLRVEDGEPCQVETSRGIFTAREVLLLTNAPESSRFLLHTKVAAYRTYAIAAKLAAPFPAGLFWDMQDPYHYVREQQTRAGRYLIVGGEDHKTGTKTDTETCFRQLEDYAARHFGTLDVVSRWSGQILEPVDGLPFIGLSPGTKHVRVATGFSGTGITFGTLSGMLLSDGVLGIANPWSALYEAKRVKPLAGAREFVNENVDFPAHLARDRLSRGEVSSVDEVPPGEGRLLRANGKMLAVSRDESGAVQAHSAVCTHMGCYVHWNGAERTWDCPCHGSRFGPDGEVVNGPATKGLEAAEPGALEAEEPR